MVLKSGGPNMTVSRVEKGTQLGAPTIQAAWFAGNKYQMGYFAEDTIELAPPEEEK